MLELRARQDVDVRVRATRICVEHVWQHSAGKLMEILILYTSENITFV